MNIAAETFGFFIVPECTLYGLYPAIEVFRVANQNSGKKLFEWHLISLDGQPIKAANGMVVPVDYSIFDCPPLSTVFAVSGNHPNDYLHEDILNWFRQLDNRHTRLGAFDSGAFILAAAGLLDWHPAVLHWETIPVFREQFPTVEILEQLYMVDDHRITCAGGSSSIDLMLYLITQSCGLELAEVVANGFVHGKIREGHEHQRPGYSMVVNEESQVLREIARYMEETLEEQTSTAEIANFVGLTVKALQKVLKKNFGMSPAKFQMATRLKQARSYLFYSTLNIQEITLACGFSSPPVFCRTFKDHFGCTPSEYRKQHSSNRLARFTTQPANASWAVENTKNLGTG